MSIYTSSPAKGGDRATYSYEILPPLAREGDGALTFKDISALVIIMMFAGYLLIGSIVGLLWPLFVFT